MAELLGALKEHEILQAAVLVIAFLVWLGAYIRGKSVRVEPERRDPYGTTTEAFFGGPVTEALGAIRDVVTTLHEVVGAIEQNTQQLEEMRTDAARHANERNLKLDKVVERMAELLVALRELRALEARTRPRTR